MNSIKGNLKLLNANKLSFARIAHMAQWKCCVDWILLDTIGYCPGCGWCHLYP